MGHPGLSGIALDEIAEPQAVGEPELLSLPQCAAELIALNDGTEVEERAGHRRRRDAVVRGRLVAGEVGPVEVDAGAWAPSPWHRYLDSAAPPDAPERGRREVTQHGARPAAQHAGHPASALGQEA